MAESTTITTLRSKRDEIAARLANYERKVAEARADLTHINATIALFGKPKQPEEQRAYMSVHRLWVRGEVMRLCADALAKEGTLSTVELAERAMQAKGLDVADQVLRKVVCSYVVHILRSRAQRHEVEACGKRNNRVILWRLPTAPLRGA